MAQADVARFGDWLTAFGDAWEKGAAADVGSLFVIGATFQATPFTPVSRGRAQIVDWFAGELARWPDASFVAQVLGAGETYGVAHYRVASSSRALDGVLVAALDARGRCTSLRQWGHEEPALVEPAGSGP